jgi:hypothetical protein
VRDVLSATPGSLVKFEESDIAVHRLPAAILDENSELSRCSAVFLPADPARTGLIAFWNPDGSTPPGVPRSPKELTVAGSDVRPCSVPALIMSVRDALPVLTRARVDTQASPSAAFGGAAGVLALQLVARGLLLPGLTPTNRDTWSAGPLTADDLYESSAEKPCAVTRPWWVRIRVPPSWARTSLTPW